MPPGFWPLCDTECWIGWAIGPIQHGFPYILVALLVDLLMAPGIWPLCDTECWVGWALGLMQHGSSRMSTETLQVAGAFFNALHDV